MIGSRVTVFEWGNENWTIQSLFQFIQSVVCSTIRTSTRSCSYEEGLIPRYKRS